MAAGPLGVVAAFGGCAAMGATAGDCGFDPPPGDFGLVHVVNDEQQPLNLFDCSDAACTSGGNLEPVPVGHSESTIYELCSGTSMGLTDAHGVLLGCLTLPIGETVTEHSYRASQFDRACAAAATTHPRID